LFEICNVWLLGFRFGSSPDFPFDPLSGPGVTFNQATSKKKLFFFTCVTKVTVRAPHSSDFCTVITKIQHKMKANMGSIDKAVRVLLALAIVALYYTGQLNGIAATILLVLAGIFILTSFVGVCPLYLPFGISTRKKTSAK